MKTIIKTILAIAAFIAPFATVNAQDQNSGDLKVTVLDEKNAAMPGAIVRIISGGSNAGGQTDLDGNYTFRALSPGNYDVEATMIGYKKFIKQSIQVSVGQTAYVTYNMMLKDMNCDTCNVFTVVAQRGPIDKTYSTVYTLNADQVKHMPVEKGDVTMMVVNTCSSCSEGPSGGLVMRGSRENATSTYVDGEKLYGAAGVPGGAIEQVTVLSGGIPASFGDMTGGVVIITTKSFSTGYTAKENMYIAAAEQREAARKAELEKSGQLKETGDQIIQKDAPAPAPVPAPAPAPAPAGGGN